MVAITRLALRRPAATVALSVGAALLCGLLAYAQLGYRTSRLDLVDPNNDYNRLWLEYIDEFGAEDDAVIVVEGASREQVVPVLEDLAQALAQENQWFHAVLHGVNLDRIRHKGLHYLSTEELAKLERFLDEVEPITQGEWARLNAGQMIAGLCLRLELESQLNDPTLVASTVQQLERLASSLHAALGQRHGYQSPWPEMPPEFATLSELSSEYLLTNEGRLGFVLLRLSHDKQQSFTRANEAIAALRRLLDRASAQHPGVKIGLTGLPLMEHDEMRASQTSMGWASLLSFVGVVLLFIAGFGGVRHAMLANAVLIVGMAWTFGYATAAVGHLNILSVAFAVTLIGIGIDYGVHYVARYLQLRETIHSTEQALLQTAETIGPAIATGAITTSVAFFAAGLTEFVGVAELGIIAGGGILLCAVAELFVLPATIALVDGGRWSVRLPQPLPVHAWIEPALRRPRATFLAASALTLVTGLGLSQLWYDHNLLNMQAEGLESVELEKRLLTECNQSLWYAVSIADSREELLARKDAFLRLKSVERTEEIVSLLPADHAVKGPLIARIQQRLAGLPERPPLLPVDPPDEVGRALGRAQVLLAGGPHARCARALEQVRDDLRRLPASDCYALLSQFQQQMAGDMLSRLYVLRSMADPEPPQLSDLPTSLVDRFVGHNNRYLLRIYGKGNIWDMEALARFVHDVRSVDPRATGNPLQAYEASLEMKRSYEKSAVYALVVILVVLFLDLRHLGHSLLALLPLATGMLQTFGILGLLDLPLNPANMIGLPLMLGIGIDYGIHVVHDWREQRGRYRMSPSTAVAVLVDSLTTVVGFGALMIASHRGLQSLGRVLTIGVSCCLLTSLVMLPALLAWISSGRQDEAPTELDDDRGQSAGPGRPVPRHHFEVHRPAETPRAFAPPVAERDPHHPTQPRA